MEISASTQCVSARLFALVPSKRTRGNRCKLKHGRVHLNVNFFVFFFFYYEGDQALETASFFLKAQLARPGGSVQTVATEQVVL